MTYNAQIQPHKPYDKCIKCLYLGKRCDGPNPLAMVNLDEPGKGLERLGEWCRLRKEYLHDIDPKWTNAYISEVAQVNKTTVDRFFAGKAEDIKISTLARIVKVLVNGTWGEYPCAMDEDAGAVEQCKKEIAVLVQDNAQLKKDLKVSEDGRIKAERVAQQRWTEMAEKNRQIKEKDKQLGERANYLLLKDAEIKALKAEAQGYKKTNKLLIAFAFVALFLAAVLPPIVPLL